MRIFSKFKQFSGYIKAMIIGALIMSCFGVYAAGTCLISATADDVTYKNTTVQAAIDDLYNMTKSYCPEGYVCLRNLYTIMATNSVLDDRASTYVTSSTGIDFSQISSDTNGKGIYEIASTKNDEYPIYYYRGAVDNNNVKFGGVCWKAIRTTDTGGVKMIYNGNPDQDGYCTNTTGESTQIGNSKFNSSSNSLAYVGYMYGDVFRIQSKSSSELSTPYIYGENITYSNDGIYTLTNTMTSTGTWTTDYSNLTNNHYTCFSTGNTCSNVYYIYRTTNSKAYYITLSDGLSLYDAMEFMLSDNIYDSAVKTKVDQWYEDTLNLDYNTYIEDTVYCNDRSISTLGGWDPNNDPSRSLSFSYLYFSPHDRLYNGEPSLECSREMDRFTVSNGILTYPVGLITSDERIYAGATRSTTNNTFYLYNNLNYWTLSPATFDEDNAFVHNATSGGFFNNYEDSFSNGVRPVISLSNSALIRDGDGTQNNPYMVDAPEPKLG